ncbi:MAG: flagellar protein FlgN [Calditrichaeota bacterium]|nr:flagellar protein FlgN [Calditrichota bacterium]
MEAILEELTAIIAREIEAFDKLLKTLHDKQRAIVEGEIDRLNSSVEEEGELASETKALEVERIDRSRRLAKELSMENLNPKLSEIIERVEKKYAQRLRGQRDLLKSLIGKVQILNQNNQFLLNYSLNYIEKSMEILLTGNKQANIYRKDGKVEKEVRKVFDQCI